MPLKEEKDGGEDGEEKDEPGRLGAWAKLLLFKIIRAVYQHRL
jgi:hypothetical protein